MRPLLLTTLALLVLAAPAQAKRLRCDARPGPTVVSDGKHRIYEDIVETSLAEGDTRSTVYSCGVGSRKPSRKLATYDNTIDNQEYVVSAQLKGRWALMDVYEGSGVTAGHALRLFDLRTGRKRAGVYAEGADAYEYVLTASGAFAAAIPSPQNLVAFDATGQRTLAPGEVEDVAAAGNRVYWTASGAPGSATLSGPPKGTVNFSS